MSKTSHLTNRFLAKELTTLPCKRLVLLGAVSPPLPWMQISIGFGILQQAYILLRQGFIATTPVRCIEPHDFGGADVHVMTIDRGP